VYYGQLSGETMIVQQGMGADPDGHSGACTPSDPWDTLASSGQFILFDSRTGHGIAQQVAVSNYQFLPGGFPNVIPVDPNQFTPSGSHTISTPPQGYPVNYPVTQGDSITFSNLDTHPHTVTACADPCTDYDPARSGAFDGDIHQLGDQYTVDTSNLKPGTYHFYCEIHHFMRGSFQVLPRSGTAAAAQDARSRTR